LFCGLNENVLVGLSLHRVYSRIDYSFLFRALLRSGSWETKRGLFGFACSKPCPNRWHFL